jgi:hypothetical protein
MILLRCLPAPAMPTTHPANLPITTRGETIEQKTANMTPAVNFRQHIDLAGLHSKLEPNSSKAPLYDETYGVDELEGVSLLYSLAGARACRWRRVIRL